MEKVDGRRFTGVRTLAGAMIISATVSGCENMSGSEMAALAVGIGCGLGGGSTEDCLTAAVGTYALFEVYGYLTEADRDSLDRTVSDVARGGGTQGWVSSDGAYSGSVSLVGSREQSVEGTFRVPTASRSGGLPEDYVVRDGIYRTVRGTAVHADPDPRSRVVKILDAGDYVDTTGEAAAGAWLAVGDDNDIAGYIPRIDVREAPREMAAVVEQFDTSASTEITAQAKEVCSTVSVQITDSSQAPRSDETVEICSSSGVG